MPFEYPPFINSVQQQICCISKRLGCLDCLVKNACDSLLSSISLTLPLGVGTYFIPLAAAAYIKGVTASTTSPGYTVAYNSTLGAIVLNVTAVTTPATIVITYMLVCPQSCCPQSCCTNTNCTTTCCTTNTFIITIFRPASASTP